MKKGRKNEKSVHFLPRAPQAWAFFAGFLQDFRIGIGLFPASLAGCFRLAKAFFAERKVFDAVFLRMDGEPGWENLAILRRKTPDENGVINFFMKRLNLR